MLHINFVCDNTKICEGFTSACFENRQETYGELLDYAKSLGWTFDYENGSHKLTYLNCPKCSAQKDIKASG